VSIGVMSANSEAKSVYAQSNSLAQKGNSQAYQVIEQLQSSDQDNQAVSGESSILSGNNLQCQNQDNSKVSASNCASGLGNVPNGGIFSFTIYRPNSETPNLILTIDQFNQAGDPIGSQITDTMTGQWYRFTNGLDPRTDSITLTISGWSEGNTVNTEVRDFGNSPLICEAEILDVKCSASNLLSDQTRIDSAIILRIIPFG